MVPDLASIFNGDGAMLRWNGENESVRRMPTYVARDIVSLVHEAAELEVRADQGEDLRETLVRIRRRLTIIGRWVDEN